MKRNEIYSAYKVLEEELNTNQVVNKTWLEFLTKNKQKLEDILSNFKFDEFQKTKEEVEYLVKESEIVKSKEFDKLDSLQLEYKDIVPNLIKKIKSENEYFDVDETVELFKISKEFIPNEIKGYVYTMLVGLNLIK